MSEQSRQTEYIERTYQVEVTETRRWTVTVRATSWLGARDQARSLEESGEVLVHRSAEPKRQIGEPWVDGGWYDLRPPSDVAVFERAYGWDFDRADVSLLQARLEACGLTVVEHWNGEGCGTVSFRCDGRIGDGPFSEEHRAILLAPRPPTDASNQKG